MQLFYTHQISNQKAYLDAEETKHCIKTLRKRVGDTLMLTDGKGGLYEAILREADKKGSVLDIVRALPVADSRSFTLHIAIAPTKNINRLEWFLEKTTELGIDAITFVQCDRSERKTIRLDRLEKIVLSAAKQSIKATFPELHDLTSFSDFVQKAEADFKGIAHCQRDDLTPLKALAAEPKSLVLLIGPEGDFSEREVALAKEHGFGEIGLGKSRLRTETAGLVACHTVHLMQAE